MNISRGEEPFGRSLFGPSEKSWSDVAGRRRDCGRSYPSRSASNKMPDARRPRIMTLRRSALLVCAAVALVVAAVNSRAFMPDHGRKEAATAAASNVAASSATARAAPNPGGFADIVDTVKPAVIAVRVLLPAHLNGDDGGELSFDDFRR